MKTLRLYIPISLLLFGLLISCKTVETAAAVEEEIVATPTSENPIDSNETNDKSTLTQVEDGDSLFAYIYRSACFGKCPTYKMSIYNDGTVMLEGIRNVRLLGTFKTKITKEEMEQFSAIADSIEFFEMNDEYDSPITDVPSTTISIVADGHRKEVYARAGYPQRIKKLSELFNQLIERDIWTAITVLNEK